MKKKIFATILTMLLLLAITFSYSEQQSILDEKILKKLITKGEIRHTFWEEESPALIPDIPGKKQIEEEIKKMNPTLGVEVMKYYKRSSIDFTSAEAMLTMYNIMRSVSAMQGLCYYSASRKKMRILFKESYVIDSPELKNKIADPLVDEIPQYSKIFITQKDLTFGKNIYQSEYTALNDNILILMKNLTTMHYFLIPVIQPGNSVTYFIITPFKDELFFYGVSILRCIKFFGLEKSREDSLYNRIKAISGWFIDNIDKIDKIDKLDQSHFFLQ